MLAPCCFSLAPCCFRPAPCWFTPPPSRFTSFSCKKRAKSGICGVFGCLRHFSIFVIVKFFCLIFAFYTLSISVMPCNDVHDKAESSISTVAEAQDHHQDHNDICSPFCICSCCQSFFALTSFPDVAIYSFTGSSNFSFYTEKFYSSSSASIWQPPKLG